jgi:hypothetical protein
MVFPDGYQGVKGSSSVADQEAVWSLLFDVEDPYGQQAGLGTRMASMLKPQRFRPSEWAQGVADVLRVRLQRWVKRGCVRFSSTGSCCESGKSATEIDVRWVPLVCLAALSKDIQRACPTGWFRNVCAKVGMDCFRFEPSVPELGQRFGQFLGFHSKLGRERGVLGIKLLGSPDTDSGSPAELACHWEQWVELGQGIKVHLETRNREAGEPTMLRWTIDQQSFGWAVRREGCPEFELTDNLNGTFQSHPMSDEWWEWLGLERIPAGGREAEVEVLDGVGPFDD